MEHNTNNVKASFDSGSFLLYTCKQACCGSKLVPPPTVPISIDGIVQLMYRSSLVAPVRSIKVMQLELPTFCAASFRSGRRKKHHIQLKCSVKSYSTKEKPIRYKQTYLTTGNIDSCNNVCCMCVVATYAASHSRTHQIFVYVHFNYIFSSCLQYLNKAIGCSLIRSRNTLFHVNQPSPVTSFASIWKFDSIVGIDAYFYFCSKSCKTVTQLQNNWYHLIISFSSCRVYINFD